MFGMCTGQDLVVLLLSAASPWLPCLYCGGLRELSAMLSRGDGEGCVINTVQLIFNSCFLAWGLSLLDLLPPALCHVTSQCYLHRVPGKKQS